MHVYVDAHMCLYSVYAYVCVRFCMGVHCVYTYELYVCLLSVSHVLACPCPKAEGRSTRPRRLQGSGPKDLLGQVARQRVEKQGEEQQQEEEQQEFEE